jgi:hypothetical protein
LLCEIINGMAAVAILGACIILFAALWGIIYPDNVLSEKRMELSPTIVSLPGSIGMAKSFQRCDFSQSIKYVPHRFPSGGDG